MARDELELRKHAPTIPDDLNDPPRFGQIIEVTKDSFVLELREFFDRSQTAVRRSELPLIRKYATGFAAGTDPFESTVQILQEFPDILEELPHISIQATAGRNKRLTFGRPIIAQVQDPPRVDGTGTETFALVDGEILEYRTKPDGLDFVTSTVTFLAARFPTSDPITAATAADVVRVINEQALHAQAVELTGGGISLQTGGPLGGCMPNEIEILSGSSANVLTELGFTIGQSDNSRTNASRPPKNRYHQASTLTVNIDIIAPDVNVRRELTDLVYGWATFWLERKHFQLHGRSVFDETIDDEHYQVIIHQEVSFGAESNVPRPNDAKDKVHVQRVTVPVTTIYYIDRAVVDTTGTPLITDSEDVTEDNDLPTPN